MKRYVNQSRKETKDWKKGDKVLLSTKDLVFKERPVRKLTEKYVGPYEIEEVVSLNAVKLWLPTSMRIHPVVNVSWIVQYKEQVKGQKKEEGKPIEVEGAKEWEVEKILNKKKNKRSREVLSIVESIHSRGRHMGKERKFEKCRGSHKRIRREDEYRD